MSQLNPSFYLGDLRLDNAPFAVARGAAVDLGAAENVASVVETLMRDGEYVVSERASNRTLTLPIVIEGADLLELAKAEARLIRECEKERNTFTVDPGDGIGKPTVFDTFRVQAVHVRDDSYEAARVRRYDLTIPALPYARSANLVTQTLAPVAAPTITTRDDATALTNWAKYVGTPLAIETYRGKSVVLATEGFTGSHAEHNMVVTWTGARVPDPYVFFDVNWDGNGSPLSRSVRLHYATSATSGAQASVTPFATESITHGTGQYVRYWFHNPATVASGYHLSITRTWPNNEGLFPQDPVPIRIGRFGSSTQPASGVVQAVSTEGSVRAPGSVVATTSSTMSWLFLYSDPAMLETGFSPFLQASWADAPEGTYVVYAQGWGAANDLLALTFTDAAGRAQTATTRLKGTLPTWRPIGEVRLGGLRTGKVGTQTITATLNGASTTVPTSLRVFRKHDDTALTYVDGISATRVELALPSADLPRGGLYAGDFSALDKAVARAYPTIVPPTTALFAESSAGAVTTTLAYFPRYHTWAEK